MVTKRARPGSARDSRTGIEVPPKVLVIDDDPDLRATLAAALAEVGFDARSAPDGPLGIEAYLEGGADVVLLDFALPGMDGIAVCRALKTLAADAFLPVIFLTGRTDIGTKVDALESGGDDYCEKPCALEELEARINAALRKRDRELRLESESGKFRKLALMDALTELGNRRAFDLDLERDWARMSRASSPLGLLMADLDHFKSVNDRFGHSLGDRALRATAMAISRSIRESDRAYRYGGEEFAVLLLDTTHEGALMTAERMRENVAELVLGPLSLTISIGVAVAPESSIPNGAALVEAADQALYAAKDRGRDRVATWSARSSY